MLFASTKACWVEPALDVRRWCGERALEPVTELRRLAVLAGQRPAARGFAAGQPLPAHRVATVFALATVCWLAGA